MANYLVHSAKGSSWKNHKYIKKIGNKYYYSESEIKEAEEEEEKTDDEKSGADKFEENLKKAGKSTDSSTKKKSTKSSSSSKKKTKEYNPIKGKGKSSSTSKKKESSEKGSGASKKETTAKEPKATKEKTTKETQTKITKQTTEKKTIVRPRVGIKNSINKVTKLSDDDQIYSKVNDDGNWEVTVDYASGESQKFTMNADYQIISKSEKEKKIKHSELYHHGILGQKWGKKNGPPYPLDFDKLSAEERQKAKEDSIREGDVKTASVNKKHYTTKELDDLINRFNTNKKLSAIANADVKDGFDKLKEYSEKLNTISVAANNAYNAYSNVAKILNALTGSELPTNSKSNDGNNKKNNSNGNEKKYVNGKLVSSKKTYTTSNGTKITKEYSKAIADKEKEKNKKTNTSHYVGPIERTEKTITNYLNGKDTRSNSVQRRIGKVKK